MEDRRACATEHYRSACQGPRRQEQRGTECRLHVLGAGWQGGDAEGVPGSEQGAGEWGERESEGKGKRRGGTGERVCVYVGDLLRCVFKWCFSVRTCVLVSIAAYCVREHADVYSFLRSNAHSQMKSSNMIARKPQLGSHGSWSCKPQWSCLNEAG